MAELDTSAHTGPLPEDPPKPPAAGGARTERAAAEPSRSVPCAPVLVAFGMFSRVPVPAVAWTPDAMRTMLAALPLVGVFQGLVVWAVGGALVAAGLPAPFIAAALTVTPVLVNGGIHLDGLSDTADALASHADRATLLRILSDPHIGAFGVLAIACHLLLAFALWLSLGESAPALAAVLPLMPAVYALSRALSGFAVATWPSAKDTGLASGFSNAAAPRLVPALLVFEAVAASLALAGFGSVPGALAVAGAFAVLGWYRHVAMALFGGVTGDLAGWFLQNAELAMLACLVAGRYL